MGPLRCRWTAPRRPLPAAHACRQPGAQLLPAEVVRDCHPLHL